MQANKDVLASSVNKPDNGIIKNDIHYTFTKWEHSNEGKIDWTIALQKAEATRKFSGKITGFLPLKKVRNQFLNKKEDKQVTITATSSDVNPPVDSKVLFSIKTKLETAKTNLNINDEKTFQDQKAVNAITKNELGLPRPSNVETTSVNKPTQGTTTSGVNYEFTKWYRYGKKGEIHWEVKLRKGLAKESLLNGKIVGYKKSKFESARETFEKIKKTFIWGSLGRTT